jgi:hypothetical protein
MNKKNAFSAKRRQFFGAAGAATLAASVIGLEPIIGDSQAQAAAVGLPSNKRRARAEKIRLDLAIQNKLDTPTRLEHPTNPDDDLYADKRGSYTKGLPHNADGTVVPAAYRSLVDALADGQGNPQLFNTIQLSNLA